VQATTLCENGVPAFRIKVTDPDGPDRWEGGPGCVIFHGTLDQLVRQFQAGELREELHLLQAVANRSQRPVLAHQVQGAQALELPACKIKAASTE
jgi:predicted esterase